MIVIHRPGGNKDSDVGLGKLAVKMGIGFKTCAHQVLVADIDDKVMLRIGSF